MGSGHRLFGEDRRIASTHRSGRPAGHVAPERTEGRGCSCANLRRWPTTRRRFYVTTAIAYANNQPGLHTLYEVIGADVIARWHRMLGDDTRFLTGTDEHSVNIAQRAAEEGLTPRAFVDEKVALFRSSEDGCSRSAPTGSSGRPIRITSASAQEMVRRAYANGDIYLGTYEGWYCPNEGFRSAVGGRRDGARDDLPEPSRRARSSG